MSCDPSDDVDRLFACFKCGVGTPESALKERKPSTKKPRRQSLTKGEGSSLASGQSQEDSPDKHKFDAFASVAIKVKRGKKISPVVFYGSPHGAPVKRPSQFLRLLREIRFELREQNNLLQRTEVWATFPRQEEALKFAKVHANVNVFSYQDHLSGQRRFLVSTYEEFWRRYKSMDRNVRHHYEVIQEGLPCHLYFDLEFEKKVNAGRNVDEMVDILISVTFAALYEKYSVEGEKEWIIELDSSTPEKFSRHLIIRIPKTAFKDNSHAGAFVSEVCKNIADSCGKVHETDKLYVKKDSDAPAQLFVDTGVYSRNRCFRLAFSSKAGKSSFLVPTGRFKCKDLNQQQIFMDSLICRMDADCDKLLTCKIDLNCRKTLCFDTEVHEWRSITSHGIASCPDNDSSSTYLMGKSPFPALDRFVESIASCGNVSGKIRSWYWFSACGLMVYSMSRNRYCERIGREHKSNHVMYIVDLQRAGYYQKCYDPDCAGYRSPTRPLPLDVIPDSLALLRSTQLKNYKHLIDVSADIDLEENNVRRCPSEVNVCATDNCNEDRSWWHEAMHYAEAIENMKLAPEFCKWDEDLEEDSEWWLDVEKVIAQLEQQNN